MKKMIDNIRCLYYEIRKLGLLYAVNHTWRFICNTFSRIERFIILAVTKKKPLKNIIIIESHNDFDCNGGAFYNYLIDKMWNKKYIIVWLIRNKRKLVSVQMPENVKVYEVNSPSIMKNYYIVRAKYFTADACVTEKVRKDQVSMFFDHGTFSLKNAKNFMNLPETIDYYLTASANFDPIYCEERSIPYPNPKLVHLGYPMHDVFYHESPSEIRKITNKPYDKVILWMPTFRKQAGTERNDSNASYPYGIPLLMFREQIENLQNLLKKLNVLLIIKIHPMQDLGTIQLLMQHAGDNMVILTANTVKELDIDNYRLLKDADALISDYSSIAYSFILLDRPLSFVLYDEEEMKYGLCVDDPEFFLTGSRIYRMSDLIGFIQDVKAGRDEYREERRRLCNWLHEYQDGLSCERIVKFLNM